jgi:hypothetical protein
MSSTNNQYSSSKFSPSKAHTPCPICEDTKGKCRIAVNDDSFVLCMTHPLDVGLSGWRYLGETKGSYYAGKYVRLRAESSSEQAARRLDNLQRRLAHQKAQRESHKKLPSASQRHNLYQGYLTSLGLDNLDETDLLTRGLSKAEITQLSAKSTQSGYILPIRNPERQILGFQIRLREETSGRYRWHKPLGIPAHQDNGELPLAFYGQLLVAADRVVLVEGTGVKPYLASKLRNCPAIGASGGQFLSSQQTLQSYLEMIGSNPEFSRIEYAIDAGDIANPAVMRRHEKNLDLIKELGYRIDVLWWGQVAKTDADIDEIPNTTNIQLLNVDQFFQIANYQPQPKFSPFTWLRSQIFPQPKSQGFAQRSVPKQKSLTPNPSFKYAEGQRIDAWRSVLKDQKHVLDASFTGTGKSYDAGRLRPESLDGIDQVIYISTDSRNVTTTTLQDWTLLPARHNGLTIKSGKLRRTQQGDSLHTQANCSRTGAISALRDKAIADTKVICETCPLLNACRGSSGDGFGFRHQRAIAFRSNILRSHPMSLPNPDEYDYSKTLLIWEEVSQSLNTLRQIDVDEADVDKAISVLLRSDLEQKQQVIEILLKLHGLLHDKSYHGLSFDQIKAAIPELVDTNLLADLLKPDLSILDTVDGIAESEFELAKGKDKQELARLHRLLKRETTLSSLEIERKINSEVLKQWLVEFLDILSSKITHGDLHIQYGKLTISLADYRLRDIAHQAASNLYLDATMDITDLQLRLNASVQIIQQVGTLAMPKILQVHNLGRLGIQRSEGQIAKVETIIKHLTALDPSTKVIDFKRFAKLEQGIWFRDSRGSNDFKDARTFIIVGTPCANIAMLRAEFVALTGLHPQAKDEAFAAFVHRHILATIQQCLGRKAGDRYNQGDRIYFLSDFDLGDIPCTPMKAGEITPEAMSKLELLQNQVVEVINSATDAGFDLVNASERQLSDFLGIKRGSLLHHFEWINPLLKDLYNKMIHGFPEIMPTLNDPQDLQQLEFWVGASEHFLREPISINQTLSGIFEFFDGYIPRHLHSYIITKLSSFALDRLLLALSLVAVRE